jgi:nucleotide-binding universal stress UspA family protein
MFNAILVPLDGSPLAEQALPVAARLARESGSALHVAHVHVAASPDPISIEGMPVMDDQLRSLAAEHERVYLERAAARVASDGLQPITARLTGPVVQALSAYARDIRAGLIVMTTHGRSGFLHLWLGSVTEALVRVAGTPLLLLRPEADGRLPDRPLKKVLVPLDGSPLAEEILPHAAELARIEGGALELLRVVDTLPVPESLPFHERFRIDKATEESELAEARRYLEALVARPHAAPMGQQILASDAPARAIVEAARAIGADAVALTTHGKSAAPRSALGSIADTVLRSGCGSLLILRPGARPAD